MKKTAVYLATHKKLNFSIPDYCSFMQVNCHNNGRWDGYLHDDEGDNISEKNPSFCELTVLYSLWKNSDADIKGLYHYRRYFGNKESVDLQLESTQVTYFDDAGKRMITEVEISETLKDKDILMAFPKHPFPLTVLEDLQRFCYLDDINKMIDIIEAKYPEYMDVLNEVFSSTNISYCNMLIARSEIFDAYCEWLFDILFELEKICPVDTYDKQHARVFGYLSEVLLNVYVIHNQLRTAYKQMLLLNESSGLKCRMIKAKNQINYLLSLAHVFPLSLKRQRRRNQFYYMMSLFNDGKDIVKKEYTEECDCEKFLKGFVGKVQTKKLRSGNTMLVAKMNYKENDCILAIIHEQNPQNLELSDRYMTYLDQLHLKLEQTGLVPLIRIITKDKISKKIIVDYMRKGVSLMLVRDLVFFAHK